MSKKFLAFILFSLFLLASLTLWSTSKERSSGKSQEEISPPPLLSVESKAGHHLGWAFPFQKDILFMPDHLWRTESPLYIKKHKIKVLIRDFQNDLLFFSLPKKFSLPSTPYTLANTPPALNQTLLWSDGNHLYETRVKEIRTNFLLGNIELKDLMSIEGVIAPGDSGSVLFDPKEKKIYGMLIAADREEGLSYFVRADKILSLFQNYFSP